MSEQTEQTGSSTPSQPKSLKNPEKNTFSKQKENSNRAIRILTLVEVTVIAVISALCFSSVRRLSHYDSYYRIYYFFPILGVIFIILLGIAYKRKWLGFQLISVILFLLWSTYAAATVYSCHLMIDVKKREAPYRNSSMFVMFDGRVYTWEGKTVVYDIPADWKDLEARATIVSRDDSRLPTEDLCSKGVDAGCTIFYQDGYKYILVEVVTGSLFEFIDPNDPPTETISTATTKIGVAG